jgi:dimethylaniline monooxygenase (N-oxide forming)
MKIVVIGCGPAGLNAVRNCVAEGYEVIAFDKSPEIGGEWYSTLRVGKDKYGVDVHSAIYESLITNLPKDIMTFSDFPYDESEKESYMTPDKVLKYFQSYADAFGLRKHIKLEHHVISVHPFSDERWQITVRDLPNDKYTTVIADKVLICVGLSVAWMPKIEGQSEFNGKVIHSRDYRNTKMFEGEKVLVIGSGLSSFDMMFGIAQVAQRVAWAHKINESYGLTVNFELPKNVDQRPKVKRITRDGAEFEDGGIEKFSIIAFATGYDFSFPFLSVDSSVSVNDKCVYPLYKHILNVNRPSLAFIGLPFYAIAIPLSELQIKFCLQYWSGRKQLPSKEDMLKEVDEEFEKKNIRNGENHHKAHYLSVDGGPEKYYQDLAETAEISPMKPVFIKMYNHDFMHIFADFRTFRSFKYRVVDDYEFLCSCSSEAIK